MFESSCCRPLQFSHPVARDVTSVTDRRQTMGPNQAPPATAAERGLGIQQLRTMMDANFSRAAGKRRRIDRALMNGEWPILLRVMGKTSVDGRYLSMSELRTLFVEQRLPPRITQRLTQTTVTPPIREES